MKKLPFIFLISGFLFFSCTNFLSENSDSSESSNNLSSSTVAFNGTVYYSGAFPYELLEINDSESAYRSASYKIDSDWTYFATATSGSDTVSGTFGSGTEARTFEISLATGKIWTITCGIKDEESTLLSDTFSVTTSVEEPVISHTFFVKPSAEGKGTINLSMTVPETVKSIKAECSDSDWPSTLASATPSGTSATFSASNVKSGTYEVTFNFYDSSNILQYTTTQSINVFDNLTTNRWYSASSENSLIKSDDGTFEVTTALINAQKRTVFYVGNTSEETASDTTGTGSPYAPFATITKAYSYMTDSSTNYKIFISGTITGIQNIPATLNGKAASLTIQGCKGLDENGLPQDVLDGNNAGSVLTIATAVPVTIKNLKITRGSSTSSGGGIKMENGSSVTLESGALIGDETQSLATSSSYGNKARSGGGGIYNEGGSLVLKAGSKICHNHEGSRDYNGGQGGGGIKCSGGTVIIYDGAVISYNKSRTRGGGINIAKGSSSASLIMNGGEISHNDATGWGGAVMQASDNTSFEMKGGKLSYNICSGTATNWAPNGGALFMDGGTFTMSGNAEISYNTANLYNGGIKFVGSTCEVHLNGGVIKNNKALGGGSGAVSMDGNPTVFTMSGSISIPYGVETDSGIEKGKGKNDIELPSGKVITITGSLTGTVPVATITPKSYEVGTTVLAAETGVTLADEVGKFTLSSAQWGINSSGSLFQYVTAANVAASLASLSANTVDTPHEIAVYASSDEDIATIKAALQSNSSKYVKITLSCSGITTLPESAFSACTSIVGITLPYGITGYGDYAFGGCSNLSELIFPESLTSTSYRALNGCTSLKSITLPESLETIGLQSFSETGLTSITIPKNVKSIPNDPFTGSTSLERVTVDPDNQNYKDIDGVLYNKSGSQLVYYPAVRTGSYDIPSSVTQIGGYAFYKSKISGVTIPNTVTSIGRRAFENCDELSAIDLPSNLRTIEDEAFALCDNLTSVTIPKSVTSIGNNPFSGCSKVTEIIVEDGSSNFVAVGGVLFNKDKTLLKCYPAGKNGASYSIPDTVTTIGSWVFRGCSLTSITIPDSVDFIYDYAFYDCSSLTSLVFTDTSTWYQTRSTSRIGGTEFDVTNTATNASNFKSGDNSYKYYYKE